jgi:PAS domain S-box-containing protein
LRSGDFAEIEGESSRGDYAPIVVAHHVKVLSRGAFAKAKPVGFEELASGKEDSQLVEVRGIVRAVRYDREHKFYQIDIATGGGRVTAHALNVPSAHPEDMVDETIIARGVCVTRFNLQRQLFANHLLVPRPEDLAVEKPAPGKGFDTRAQPIESLLQFSPQGTYGHRVKVAGTVIYQRGNSLYIENGKTGLYAQTVSDEPVHPGDTVEVLGFADKGEYNPMLQDSIYRKTGAGTLPKPDEITAHEALTGAHDCRLVRIEAKLLDRARHSFEPFLVLESDGFIFHAYLAGGETDFDYLQNGCKVAVTGVCLIETGSDWKAGNDWRAKSFRLLMRGPGDITVREQVPWWSLRKVLWIAAAFACAALAAMAWVAVLRRRVHEQTNIIRQKLEAEATLKERYEDLFENANDMAYTHGPDGRITSINQAGVVLLQRSRQDILSRNIVDFIVEEQQAAARQWLDQIARGAGPMTTEWDFSVPATQRLRLEISTRPIENRGVVLEIEGMARDITERKRLEREILEISNREQRRIGHDLHDGVCQQLAGIALMTATLADQLNEKSAAEARQGERISGLLNDVIRQTRGVARGLFPVRLEENGLVSALEELAATAEDVFKTPCQFVCGNPPAAVDHDVGIHLYYIAHEGVANACKHGGASSVTISLEPQADRYALCVRDDGRGFVLNGKGHAGMGIRIMQYRAKVIGATLTLRSAPGMGTDVACLFLPMAANASRNGANGHHKNGHHD